MMMMMKMKWFLLFAALLLITPTYTEVVDSVSKCPGFVLKDEPPQIPGVLENGIVMDQNRYKLICQTFEGQQNNNENKEKNKKRFLTLYDTTNRIPVFSAYKFQEIKDNVRQRPHWMIEPQLLGHVDMDTNMVIEYDIHRKQASDLDYIYNARKKDCNKGHLYPSCHAPETDDKKSTFTLTNIVPQVISFNNGSWNTMECNIKDVMEDFYRNNQNGTSCFVVVGAKPSEGKKLKTLNNRVNIPSMLWSAFYCYSSNKSSCIAGAHWGDNIVEPAGKILPTKTVEELNAELSKWKEGFNVFPGKGKCLEETVPDSGQDSNEPCDCIEPVPDPTDPSLQIG